MRGLRACLKLNQGGHRLAVTARTGEQRDGDRIHAATAFGSGAKHQQGIDCAAFKGTVQIVACLEGEAGRVMAMPGSCANPALAGDNHRHRLVKHPDFQHCFLFSLYEGAARVGELFGVSLNFLDHQPLQGCWVGKNFLQPALLFPQTFKFLLNLDGFQPGQLAQADFKNVFSLPVTEVKAGNQRGLGLIGLADDGNHLVNIEQHQLPPFEDVDAVQHLVQAVL